MRILVISNYYPPFEIGGWEQLTRDVTNQLTGRGHTLQVLTSRHRATEITRPEPTIARQLYPQSPDPFHYRARSTLFAPFYERQNRQILAHWLAQFRPDIIFINGLWNLSPRLALAAEQMQPSRVIYYLASPWPLEPDLHTIFWDDPAGRAWRRWPKKWLRALLRPLFLTPTPARKLAFRQVLCVSGYIQQMMIEQVGLPQANTQIVYNGIEPELFTMRAFDSSRPGLRLLYAGQIRADKGLHTAIEALSQAQSNHPNLTLTIIGSGSPAYIQQLHQRIQQLGLDPIITFHQQVAREGMPAVFANHDVLLFPSIWPEPLARVVQEAMACGLVVIGTTTGGTPEILSDGHNGLTFTANNEQELAEKIGQIAGDPALAHYLALNARQTVESRFTLSRMVDQIEAHLTNQLSQLPPI